MKRIATLSLSMMLVLSCCLMTAGATNAEDARASITILGYSSTMSAGSARGELRINYQVNANLLASQIGASSIDLYKSDGSDVTTINGSTGNGLIRTSGSAHSGTYSYTATSGVSYYAKVTIFASSASTSDSRTITTSTVTAA